MNLIIDGMNMAFRCSFIYDKKQGLTSTNGQPTGTIYGFLRQVVNFRKQYRNSPIWVVWEGKDSLKERKASFPDYKANRDAKDGSPLFSQIGTLRKALEDFGVHQAWEDGKEADDVIASLTRGLLKEDSNMIVSSDKDLLQLVTNKTVLMTPHKALIYDRDQVEREYGVSPERLVSFRALDGDKSDNIPGMKRFPRKKIAEMVNACDGNLENLYKEQPLELTEYQEKTFREFQNQAETNLNLMALRTSTTFTVLKGEHNTDNLALLTDQLGLESLREDLQKAPSGFSKSGEPNVCVFHSESGPTSII